MEHTSTSSPIHNIAQSACEDIHNLLIEKEFEHIFIGRFLWNLKLVQVI